MPGGQGTNSASWRACALLLLLLLIFERSSAYPSGMAARAPLLTGTNSASWRVLLLLRSTAAAAETRLFFSAAEARQLALNSASWRASAALKN